MGRKLYYFVRVHKLTQPVRRMIQVALSALATAAISGSGQALATAAISAGGHAQDQPSHPAAVSAQAQPPHPAAVTPWPQIMSA